MINETRGYNDYINSQTVSITIPNPPTGTHVIYVNARNKYGTSSTTRFEVVIVSFTYSTMSTSPSSTPLSTNTSSSSVAVIVGGAVGGGVAILLLIVIAVFIIVTVVVLKKKKLRGIGNTKIVFAFILYFRFWKDKS